MLTRLFVKLLSDYLNEVAYDAELAGLSWGLNATTSGFLVSFFGCALTFLVQSCITSSGEWIGLLSFTDQRIFWFHELYR